MAVIKGIVLERRDNGAVILTRSGRFRFVGLKKKLPEVGAEIQCREWGQDLLWYGAAVAVLFFLMFQVALFMAPAMYLTVEGKPGIKLGVNRFGLVVKASATNESGDSVLEQVPMKGRRAESALREMVDEALTQGIFKDSGQEVTLVMVPVNQAGERLLKSAVPSFERSMKEKFREKGRPDLLLEVKVTRGTRG